MNFPTTVSTWRMLLGLALGAMLIGTLACGSSSDDDDDTTANDDDTMANDDDDDMGANCPDQTRPLSGTDDTCVISGTINEDLTLTSDLNWLLNGGVFIGNDDGSEPTLTIEAGTTIFGDTASNSMLVIQRGAKIMAMGTADAPIVMTSAAPEGSRARGDWGGLIINGRAPINACPDEGACEAFGEGGAGFYGGNDPADDSGVLHYVRVEFAGRLISPDNELNGIAFQGVGSGTEVDYIQVHQNADDGVEFFGGNAHVKHIVVSAVGDDMLDWTDGWQGKVQFAVLQQWDDAGDQGIEADNNGEDNEAEPVAHPTISHVTIIGQPESDSSDLGMLLREGTEGDLSCMLVMGFNDAGLMIDQTATHENADNGSLTVTSSILSNENNYKIDDENPYDPEPFFTDDPGNMVVPFGTDILVDPFNIGNPDFNPVAGSPAVGAGICNTPADGWFDDASDYIGGIGDDDWTAGWTAYPAD